MDNEFWRTLAEQRQAEVERLRRLGLQLLDFSEELLNKKDHYTENRHVMWNRFKRALEGE